MEDSTVRHLQTKYWSSHDKSVLTYCCECRGALFFLPARRRSSRPHGEYLSVAAAAAAAAAAVAVVVAAAGGSIDEDAASPASTGSRCGCDCWAIAIRGTWFLAAGGFASDARDSCHPMCDSHEGQVPAFESEIALAAAVAAVVAVVVVAAVSQSSGLLSA